MNKFNLTALSAALFLALSASAIGATMSPAEYKAAKADITAKYKTDKAACKSQSGNAADICVQEAKGHENIAKAELEANFSPSEKHKYDAVSYTHLDVYKRQADSGNARSGYCAAGLPRQDSVLPNTVAGRSATVQHAVQNLSLIHI